MATFDFAIVVGDQHFDRGADVPDDVVEKIANPKIVGPADDAPSTGDHPPAKSEKKEVWAAYAAAHGVQVADTATKDEIISAVEAAAS